MLLRASTKPESRTELNKIICSRSSFNDFLNSFKSEAFASLAYYPYRLSAFKFVIACVVLYCKFISEERVESKKSLF